MAALANLDLPGDGRRLAGQIQASTVALDGLFSALLDISRLDAGVVEVHRRPFPVAPLLDRVCADHAAEARDKGVLLDVVASTAVVDTDPVLVEQVVRNLLSNAVRHTDRGRVLVGCRRRGSAVAVSVWDTGRGIAVEHQARVFDEYFQVGNSARDRTKGLGLGLAIVRRVAGVLGCELAMRSWPGRGSCFEVLLPRATRPAAVIAVADVGLGRAGGGTVLVIDDEALIRDGMCRLLADWGYAAVAAASAAEAVTLAAGCSARPALIIADLRLEDGASGIDAIGHVRAALGSTVPALLITGDTAPERLLEARASGLVLLHKPVPKGRLRAAVNNLAAVPACTEAEP